MNDAPVQRRLATALADRYGIERELGAGGMATVYLAHDLKHQRDVAIKVLHPDLGAALGGVRFLSEIRTTARLQHPHILPLLDSGDADGLLYYVMPLVTGETLRARLERERQLPIADALLIAREVADALHYAHGLGVIHRDIKPENILLQGGHALVADFGIALAVQSAGGARMTQTGLSLGTPQYMSPEQAMGEKTIDARSDVYALGAMTYEMLAGEPPFAGPTVQAIVAKVLNTEPVPLASLRKAVPPHVAAAVHMALEKLPADRCESAKAFIEALANTNFATTPDRGASTRTPLPRRRTATIVASGAALMLTTAAATWWAATRNVAEPEPVHFTVSTAPHQALSTVIGSNLALSPDGRVLVFATADSAGTRHLFRRALNEIKPREIIGTDGAETPFFSPDGTEVGYFVASNLMKIPLAGGTPRQLADIGHSGLNRNGASWGRAGIVVSTDDDLLLVPATGGAAVPVAPDDSAASGTWPVFIAGSNVVLYRTSQIVDWDSVAAIDVSTRKITRLQVSGFPLGVTGGELIFRRGGGGSEVLAIPFDTRALRVTGAARVVVGSVTAYDPTGETKAVLSTNGSLAYIPGNPVRKLTLFDLDGTARPTSIPAGEFTFPRFSPDGRQVAVEKRTADRSDVYVYEVASGAERRLTSDGKGNGRPDWSPDGRRIVFQRDRGDAYFTLWWQAADGSTAAEPLVAVPGQSVWSGAITPDGKHIVVRVRAGENADIWYRSLNGDTTRVPFAVTRFREASPRVSPDGRWVAFSSNESGVEQIYVRPFPGPGAAIPVSLGGGTNPVWSRDMRTIFFDFGTRMFAASLALTPTFQVTSRRFLFEGPQGPGPGHAAYDVSPDGKSILMAQPVGGAAEEIVVIYRWAAEMQAGAKAEKPQ